MKALRLNFKHYFSSGFDYFIELQVANLVLKVFLLHVHSKHDSVLLICRCLLDHGADVAAVNNEGELPLDLAEEDDMEDLLTEEIERLGM